MNLKRSFTIVTVFCGVLILSACACHAASASSYGYGYGSDSQDDNVQPPAPPLRSQLEELPKENRFEEGESALPFDIRKDAMKEAALSFGARGGLVSRTYEIREELEQRASYLDKVFDFRQLLIPAPSGLLLEPPVVSEQMNAMIIGAEGQEAAVADRVYDMYKNAKIVSNARVWRNYLERDWGEVTPPPDILRPNDEEERARWIKWIREGWKKGIEQANEIFEEDINLLMADYTGMVRYRMLLTQGMVSQPFTLHVDRGITGGGTRMRVGDRAIRITGKPEFMPEAAQKWLPANR